MVKEIAAENKLLGLQKGQRFYYTIQPIEITNFLGAAVAVLDEYSISDSAGNSYKLYRTKEGNFYYMPEENKGKNKFVLMSLKNGLNPIINDGSF